MNIAANNKAEKDFEELLSAVWAAQLAQLRAQPDSSDSAASSGDNAKAQEVEE